MDFQLQHEAHQQGQAEGMEEHLEAALVEAALPGVVRAVWDQQQECLPA